MTESGSYNESWDAVETSGTFFAILAIISSPLDWCEGWELSGGKM